MRFIFFFLLQDGDSFETSMSCRSDGPPLVDEKGCIIYVLIVRSIDGKDCIRRDIIKLD